MKLIEVFKRTPEEIKDQQKLHDLRMRGDGLSSGKKRRLAELETSSRRVVIRRGLATLGLGLGSLAVVGSYGFIANAYGALGNNNVPEEIANTRLIDDEIRRLGIQLNVTENTLWVYTGITPYSKSVLMNKSVPIDRLISEINPRVDSIVNNFMPKSQNPYIVEASRFIRHLRDDLKILEISPTTDSLIAGRGQYTMGFTHFMKDGKIYWLLSPTAEMILGETSLDIALQFVHEGEHIKDFLEEYDLLDRSLPEDAKYELLKAVINRNWLKKESRAYGMQGRAAIYERGLIGRGVTGAADAELLKCGDDIQGVCWQGYVDRRYVSGSRR